MAAVDVVTHRCDWCDRAFVPGTLVKIKVIVVLRPDTDRARSRVRNERICIHCKLIEFGDEYSPRIDTAADQD